MDYKILSQRKRELKKALKKKVARLDVLEGQDIILAYAQIMAEGRKALGLYMEVR